MIKYGLFEKHLQFEKKNLPFNLMLFVLQYHAGKYRGLQGNPCNKNRIPAMRTGFPVMQTGCFPVSLIGFEFGFGFALQ
jgi:hypothetical protein